MSEFGKPSFGGPRERKAQRVSATDLVRTGALDGGDPATALPLVVEPNLTGDSSRVEPMAWAAAQREWIRERLNHHGALLFRGFDLASVERFQEFFTAGVGTPLPYTERSSPRSTVQGHIYTSTDYPPEREIYLHNEQSYNRVFPLRIAFFCAVAPAPGRGATPIADSRRVFARLPAALRREFAARGYTYVRNLGAGFGLPWQTAFQTEDPAAVAAYGAAHGIDIEWQADGRLRTRQVRAAVARHPQSGALSWFNHATFFHLSTLDADVQEQLAAAFAPEDLPNQTYWGDGTPFEPAVLDALHAAYAAEKRRFDWQQGDVLLLDNLLVGHGREAFSGPRKIVVSMAEPTAWEQVQVGPQELAADSEGAPA